MKKTYLYKIFISFISILSVMIGFSSWIYVGTNSTENNIKINDETNSHNVTVHGILESNSIITEKHYYTPKDFTISHTITPYNAKGELEYQTYTWKIFGSTKTTTMPKFYEIRNGQYFLVNQWFNNSFSNTQITSFDCDITTWTETTSANYGDVWDCTVKKSDGTDYRLFFQENSGRGKTYTTKEGDTIYEDIFKSDEPYIDSEGNYVQSTIYLKIVAAKHYRYQNGYDIIPSYSYNHYPLYQLRKEVTLLKRGPSTNLTTNKNIIIKNNEYLSPIDLGIENYKEYGYYSDENYLTPFDFSLPITSDTDIYIRYLDTNNNEIYNSINTGSNSIINIYNSLKGSSGNDSSTDFNVVGNPSYNVYDDIFYLGESIVGSGSVLSLTFDKVNTYVDICDGSTDKSSVHQNKKDNSIAYDYEGSTFIGDANCSLYVSLTGNLTIKGALNVGGHVGGTGGTYYSYLIGKYTVLDLHGYDLIVDGGTVTNFGIIKDTLGTGKIIVKNNGKITSTVSVSDGRSKNQSIIGFAKRQAPFTEYHIMYLLAPVYFYYGTTFQFYLKMDLDDVGIHNLYFNFISPNSSSNDSVFCWNGKTTDEDYILYKPCIEPEIYKNLSYYLNGYYLRNQFTIKANIKSMKNLSATLTVLLANISKTFTVDLLRIDFPISPYFDLIVYDNYELSLYNKFIFYPGSSLYIKKKAKLKFSYYGETKYSAISEGALGLSITIPGEDRYLCGGIVNFSNCLKDISKHKYYLSGVYSQTSNYFNIIKPANIAIDGDLIFDNSITHPTNTDASYKYNDSFYILAGEMNINKQALDAIVSNKNNIQTYDLKAELIDGFVYGKKVDGNSYANSESEYEIASCYNIQPLVVNGNAYFVDENHYIVGEYKKESNIIYCSDDEVYTLMSSDYMYEGGDSKSDQTKRVDRSVLLTRVQSYNEDSKIIILEDGTKYLLFSGCYVRILDTIDSTTFTNNQIIRIDTTKFISNRDGPVFYSVTKIPTADPTAKTTEVVNYAPLYKDVTIYYNSTYKNWTYKYFTAYPTIDLGSGYRYSY